MPVRLSLQPAFPVAGVELATVACGVKRDGSPDLVLMRLADGTVASAVFTKSAFAAAPVTVAREHVVASGGSIRALLVNAGNANAGTGEPGIAMARGHCEAVADALGVDTTAVLPFSTGVIGQLLPDDRMRTGIVAAASALAAPAPDAAAPDAAARDAAAPDASTPGESASLEAWRSAAAGIMTTDTVPKLTSRRVTLADGSTISVTGLAKGAGMIEPHMATMLAYVFTDATIERADLHDALERAVEVSFNAISVDGDTSTNDACVLCATGQGASLSPGELTATDAPATDAMAAGTTASDWQAFTRALDAVFIDLAQAIVRDAEGATKFITVRVEGGRDRDECRAVAYSVANSPLVKTAMFASDANVGRLLMAIGKADVAELDPAGVTVTLGDVCAFERGGIADGYTEARGAAVMAAAEIAITIDLGRGDAAAEVYTSDLSHEYVSVNADYRS